MDSAWEQAVLAFGCQNEANPLGRGYTTISSEFINVKGTTGRVVLS
jgi:hypothetical protein